MTKNKSGKASIVTVQSLLKPKLLELAEISGNTLFRNKKLKPISVRGDSSVCFLSVFFFALEIKSRKGTTRCDDSMKKPSAKIVMVCYKDRGDKILITRFNVFGQYAANA